MAEVASAYVSLLPSARGFGTSLNRQVGPEVDRAGKRMGSRFGTLFKVGAAAALGGAVILTRFLSGAVDEAREAQKVSARTENVIKSMGLKAKVSAGQIAELAEAISLKTGIDDEAIQSGENLLLTFKNIASSAGENNGVFEQSTRLMVDLSTAMGTDTKGAAIQLGKALNDPVKGITALTRVGVSFTEQQKKQIENFVEAGDLASAQGIILDELKNQFGGAAEAMATPADKLKVAWGNVKEEIGTALIPVLDRLVRFILNDAIPALRRWWEQTAPAREVIANVAAGIGEIVGLIRDGKWSEAFDKVKEAASIAFHAVLDFVKNFITTRLLPAIVNKLSDIKDAWSEGWANFWEDPAAAFRKTEGQTDSFGTRMSAKAGRIGVNVVASLTVGLSKMPGAAVKIGLVTVEWLARGLRGMPALCTAIGVSTVANLVRALSAAPAKLAAWAARAVASIRSGLSKIPPMAYAIGVNIISSLIAGIKAMAGAAVAAAVGVVGDAVKAAKDALKIGSPSKVFVEIGMWTMRGLAKGVTDNEEAPADAVRKSADKMISALKEKRDAVKAVIDQIKSDIASLTDSIASAFAGNPFEAATGSAMFSQGVATMRNLSELRKAFKKLRGWGIDPKFLSALFTSGNSALILDLASGPKWQAVNNAGVWGANVKLADKLGGQVARNQYGKQLDRANDRLEQIEKAIKQIGRDVGREINGAATAGHRGRAA